MLETSRIELARRYAYLLFFRCSVPMEAVTFKSASSEPEVSLSELERIFAGNSSYMNQVCKAIVESQPFVIKG